MYLRALFFVALLLALPASRAYAYEGWPPFLLQWGSEGTGDGQFTRPGALAVGPQGYVYVTDIFAQRVQVFTPDGVFLFKWGNFQTLGNRVHGIAVSETGDVFVTGDAKVFRFTSTGTPITSWSLGVNSLAFGIAVDHDGFVYVTDFSSHLVAKYTADGTLVARWGKFGSLPGQFNHPNGIAADPYHNIYVCDGNNGRVQRFHSDSTYVMSISGSAADSTLTPGTVIAADQYGHVFIPTGYYQQVQVWDSTGVFWYRWGRPGTGPGQFDQPAGIALTPTGEVYVADAFNHRIQKFGGSAVGVPTIVPGSNLRVRVEGSPVLRGHGITLSVTAAAGAAVSGVVCRVNGSVVTTFEGRIDAEGKAIVRLERSAPQVQGVYFVRVRSERQQATSRFVVLN